MAAFAQLMLARPLAADLRRPWETRPADSGHYPRAGSAAGLQTSAPSSAPPPMSLNPPGQDQDDPRAPRTKGPATRYPVPKKPRTTDQPGNTKPQVKG